jgi:protein SCO1/2
VRRALPVRAALAALLVAAATATVPAQVAEPVPELEGIDVIEHLDAKLPLDLELVDESGNAVKLGDYFSDERPVLLTLAYYRCPMLCGLVLSGVVESLSGVDLEPGRDFEILTVSIDPTDTPEKAAAKKQTTLGRYERDGASEGWHFLTGREENVRRLADTLGFGYRWVEERDEFAHPAVVFVATPDGRVARYLYGVQYDPRTMRLSLVEASEGKIGSSLDRFLLYCYHYDPEAGRYSPVAMNVMRVGGGLTLAVLAATLYLLWRRDLRRRRRASHPSPPFVHGASATPKASGR